MPFQSRPPSPLFARRFAMPREASPQLAEKKPTEPAMRMFPLEVDAPTPTARHRAVNPLSHQGATPQIINPIGQRMAASPVQMPASLSPQGGHVPKMPHHPQAHAAPMHTAPPHGLPPHATPSHGLPPHAMPPHAAPTPHPAAPPSPPSPQRAADHFNRVNRGLPDGVMYEPLDEQTLKLLREKGHLPAPPTAPQQPATPQQPTALQPQPTPPAIPQPQPTPQQPTPTLENTPTPPPPPHFIKTLEALLQDTHNAQIFYAHLAKTHARDVFNTLQQECTAQTDQYNTVLAQRFQHFFKPQDAAINTELPLDEAIKLALVEENKMINTLNQLLEAFDDPQAQRVLQLIVNKKIAAYQRLWLLV